MLPDTHCPKAMPASAAATVMRMPYHGGHGCSPAPGSCDSASTAAMTVVLKVMSLPEG